MARKRRLNIYTSDEFERLSFPDWFTLHLSYAATGEGSTRGLAVCHCDGLADLQRCIDVAFGSFYGRGVEVRPGVRVMRGFEGLVPRRADVFLRKIRHQRIDMMFSFSTILHVNYS